MKNKSATQAKWAKHLLLAFILLMVLILTKPGLCIVQLSGSWTTDLTHSAEAGDNRLLVFIAHARHGVRYLSLDSVTYGGQPMTKVTDCNAVNQGRIYSVAYVLNEAGIAAATDSNFVVTWRVTSTVPQYALPSAVGYSSAFFTGVSQDSPLGATGIKAVITSDIISLNSGLATNNGDMVIYGVSENSSGGGSFAPNNGFTEGIEQLILQSGSPVGAGETGYKPASGLDETPSATCFVTANSQAMLGFVVNTIIDANIANNPNPDNYAANIAINTNLSWTGGVGSSYFDVYLGTDPVARNNPVTRVYANSYDPPNDLLFSTQYYWAVDANINDIIYQSDNWTFTTIANKVTNPSPANGQANVSVTSGISWSDAPRVTNYEVYFGLDSNVRNNPKNIITANSYDPPGNLEIGLRYYWVVDVNDNGTIIPGDTLMFTIVQFRDPNYTIANWYGFCTSATTYTFDAQYPTQFTEAIPMFNDPNFDFHATFEVDTSPTYFTVYPTPGWDVVWAQLRDAFAHGHEITANTMTHPHLRQLTADQQRYEILGSIVAVEANVPGTTCETFAIPYCEPADDSILAEFFIAARTCTNHMETNTPSNFYRIASMTCGDQGINTPEDFNAMFEQTDAAGGWNVFLMHNFTNDPLSGYSPIDPNVFRSTLQYLAARRDRFWVDTFANVVKYIRERNDASIVETAHLDDSITLRVTTILDTSIFNHPLSIRRPLPTGWLSAYVSQNGVPLDVTFEEIGLITYIIFDAVPSGGEIVLTKALYGDFDGNGKVEYADLPDFVDYWLIEDCNEAAAGIDLNDDCRVNFYEFSVMAENWLKTR